MFTGIITHIGRVAEITPAGASGDMAIRIATPFDASDLAIGASVSLSGACHTVVARDAGGFLVQTSAETLSKTTLGGWTVGSAVNLERSLRLGDELGGHIVSGHVDGVARLVSLVPEGGSHRLTIEVPADLARFIAPKGSVALDGISLTVNAVDGACFGVNIIAHTWTHTTLHARRPGDGLNLEVDLLARYVARLNEFPMPRAA
ncbi:MAG: riboflavin synthase [Thalassobaculales bacterium]